MSRLAELMPDSRRNLEGLVEDSALEPWILNDSPRPVEAGVGKARILVGAEVVELGSWPFEVDRANRHVHGRAMRAKLPNARADAMQVELVVQGRSEMNSSYTLGYSPEEGGVSEG
jgi:hypothetical protein